MNAVCPPIIKKATTSWLSMPFCPACLCPRQYSRIRGEEGPDHASQAYEDELHRFFGGEVPRFTLLLGVGEDGHTASLFPGSAQTREKKRFVRPVHFDLPKLSRVTLTLPVLNEASQVLFFVSGRSKARIVHEIIEDGNPQACPAGLIQPVRGDLVWMLDHDAAAALVNVAMGKKAAGE